MSLSNLSVWLAELGQHQEAADLARQALAAQQRVLGPEHPDTLTMLSNLSKCSAGSIGAASGGCIRVARAGSYVAAQQRVCGPEHPSTLISTLDWGS